MHTLSQAIELTRSLAQGRNYGAAASKALRQMGFGRPEVTTVRIARIVNDIGAIESSTLLSAVTAHLGKEGGKVIPERKKQLELVF